MIKQLLRFALGTYEIRATSNTERFLNELIKRNIKIFRLKKSAPLAITFCVYKKVYPDLKAAAEKTGTELCVIKNKGLAHLLRNYKKRLGLPVGALIFSAVLYLSTLFLWQINISGTEKTSNYQVLQMLEDSGLKTGKLKSSCNIKQIENDFLLKNKNISWVSVNIKGTCAYVEVREKNEVINMLDAKEPCSIYASRDGVIASIHAYMGYPVLQKGDTVTAGQLVVTGNYTDKYGQTYQLHSFAKVMAHTQRSYNVTVDYKQKYNEKTGRQKNKYSLKLIRFTIPLYFSKNIRYNNYDITITEKTLCLGKNFVLPFCIVKKTYTEVIPKTKALSQNEAKTKAQEQFWDFEYNLVGITVKNRTYDYQFEKDRLNAKITLDCYENIATPGKLD